MDKDVERRLTELEIKASFTEDLVERLNEVVVEQQARIAALLREVAELRRQQQAAADAGSSRSLLDEVPPHY